jgi:ribosomal protein S18 acetylase RimI-like enzyme
MITVSKATRHGILALSRKLQSLLEDKTSKMYQDNVAKFGIPIEYGREAFSEATLLKAAASGKSTFYLALNDRHGILGFAQTVQRDAETVELDRIVVFPEYTRKGIGTQILYEIIKDAKLKKAKAIIVSAGKDEAHARRFYEKNGFNIIKEEAIEPPWGGRITLVTYRLHLEKKPKAGKKSA